MFIFILYLYLFYYPVYNSFILYLSGPNIRERMHLHNMTPGLLPHALWTSLLTFTLANLSWGNLEYDILANLVNDSFYVSLLKYVESMANILKADYIEYVSLLFLSANEIHRRQEFVFFLFIVFAF